MQEFSTLISFLFIFMMFAYYDYLDRKYVSMKAKIQARPYEEVEKELIENQKREISKKLNLRNLILSIISIILLVCISVIIYFYAKKEIVYISLILPIIFCMSMFKYMIGFINKYINQNLINKLLRCILIVLIVGSPIFAISKIHPFEIRFYIYLFLPLIWYTSMDKKYLTYGFLSIVGILIISEVSYRLNTQSIEFVITINIGTSFVVSGLTGFLIDLSKDKKEKREKESIRAGCLELLLISYEELWFKYNDCINEIIPDRKLTLEKKIEQLKNVKNLFRKNLWKKFVNEIEEFYLEFVHECDYLLKEENYLAIKKIFSRYELSILETIKYRYQLLKEAIDKKENKNILKYIKLINEIYNEKLYENCLEEIVLRGKILRTGGSVSF